MIRSLLAALLGLALATGAARAAGPAAELAAAPEAWRAAYDSMEGARGRGGLHGGCDAVGQHEPRTHDRHGRDRRLFRTDAAGRRRDLRHLRGVFAAGGRTGVAVASGHYTFHRRMADGRASADPSRFSMTFVRGADGLWRIADHHSSRLPAAP